jgi:catalase
MPLPTDEKLVQLGQKFLEQFDAMFGEHPGFRPAHAKGALLSGTFVPAAAAALLTRAPHMNRSVPVTARFSNSTGLPAIPDNNANANPRGMAIRFHLAERVHTDIISHSTNGFPTRTGEEFLAMLRAAVAPDQAEIQKFLGAHPAALAFVQTPKPAPSSFAREAYFAVTAMRFINDDGVSRFGRYRLSPEAGVEHLDDAAVAARTENYLFDELEGRINAGPIRFRVSAQLANDGDVVDDATVHWPEDRAVVDLGTVELMNLIPNSVAEQRQIIFDPIPRVDGIEASNDPLLELRAAVYLLSGRRRREAAKAATA